MAIKTEYLDEYEKLIRDSCMLLERGHACYVYKKEQVDRIVERYENKTNLKLIIYNYKDTYELVPLKKYCK